MIQPGQTIKVPDHQFDEYVRRTAINGEKPEHVLLDMGVIEPEKRDKTIGEQLADSFLSRLEAYGIVIREGRAKFLTGAAAEIDEAFQRESVRAIELAFESKKPLKSGE